MKECPYCGEQIQDEATVCLFCGNDLGGMQAESRLLTGYQDRLDDLQKLRAQAIGKLRSARILRNISAGALLVGIVLAIFVNQYAGGILVAAGLLALVTEVIGVASSKRVLGRIDQQILEYENQANQLLFAIDGGER